MLHLSHSNMIQACYNMSVHCAYTGKKPGKWRGPEVVRFRCTVDNERLHQYNNSQRTIPGSSHLSYEIRPVAEFIDDAARIHRIWQYGILISLVSWRKIKNTNTVHGRLPYHQRHANSQYCSTHCSENLHMRHLEASASEASASASASEAASSSTISTSRVPLEDSLRLLVEFLLSLFLFACFLFNVCLSPWLRLAWV
jgi:hypothetical protein